MTIQEKISSLTSVTDYSEKFDTIKIQNPVNLGVKFDVSIIHSNISDILNSYNKVAEVKSDIYTVKNTINTLNEKISTVASSMELSGIEVSDDTKNIMSGSINSINNECSEVFSAIDNCTSYCDSSILDLINVLKNVVSNDKNEVLSYLDSHSTEIVSMITTVETTINVTIQEQVESLTSKVESKISNMMKDVACKIAEDDTDTLSPKDDFNDSKNTKIAGVMAFFATFGIIDMFVNPIISSVTDGVVGKLKDVIRPLTQLKAIGREYLGWKF